MSLNSDHPTHDHRHQEVGPTTVRENAPYAYSLVSWGSVFAGAVIAVALGAMLNIAGVALGLSTLSPGDRDAAEVFTVGAGLWLALSTVVGMLVGGYVAARSAHNPDHHEGALHGASVWAVGFLLAFFLTGSAVSGAAFSGLQAAGAAAESADSTGAQRAASALRDAADTATPDTGAERESAEDAADATSAAAWWAFVTMLGSLIAALIGGTLGARHDDRIHRPRRTTASNVF
jgi:hypothetical protein